MTINRVNHYEGDWGWKCPSPFSQVVEIGDQVFVSGQQALSADGEPHGVGDIAAQTRAVFENMKRSLERVGLELLDLVRLNTYYVFEGDDSDATEFWENMTRVRLEYFPDPGPAATAVRIKGLPYAGQLIQIEGIAVRGAARRDRKRIMPDGSWDWSIPIPLSQGWDTGDRVYVGGQISADETGAAVHVGDLAGQTRAIYGFIGEVLEGGGASFADVAHLKLCVKHNSVEPDGTPFLSKVLEVTKEYFEPQGTVVTCFGVDLLYPGLDLEIDAMAFKSDRVTVDSSDPETQPHDGYFADGINSDGEVWIGGQVALDDAGSVMSPGDVVAQSTVVFERLRAALSKAGATLDDVVKLNLFFSADDELIEDDFADVLENWTRVAPDSRPAMTPVRVYELSQPGLLIQADCVAITTSD